MYVGLSKEHEALRDELRAYYDNLLTPEVEEDLRKGEGVGQVSKDDRGSRWPPTAGPGVGWPKEWGGQGLTPIEQFVFFDESMRAGAPVPMLTINSVAPTIMRYGSEEQKQFYVPKILKGEIHFAIGYTEPDAGTDLASLKTQGRARRRRVRHQRPEGLHQPRERLRLHLARGAHQPRGEEAQGHLDHHRAHRHARLLVRADRQLRRRRTRTSRTTKTCAFRSATSSARRTAAGGSSRTSSTTSASRCARRASSSACSTTCASWAQETKLADGRRVIDQEWVQVNLARVHAKLEFLRLANWQVAWLAQSGAALNPADASTIKVYGTEFYMEAARLLMEVMRDQAPLTGDSPGAVLRGRVERMLRCDAHPHVRRRHQRDATRPDRDLRAQHARQPPLNPEQETTDGLLTFRRATGAARARGAHPRRPHGPRST